MEKFFLQPYSLLNAIYIKILNENELKMLQTRFLTACSGQATACMR